MTNSLLVLAVIIGFITLALSLQIHNWRIRGRNLSQSESRYYKIWSIVGVLTILTMIIALLQSNINNFSDLYLLFNNTIFQISIGALILLIIGAVVSSKLNPMQTSFGHLTFHYSENKNDQGYVEFRELKRAYPISQHLEACIKKNNIFKVTHTTEKDILAEFQKNNVTVSDKFSSLADIELMERLDGSITRREHEIDTDSLKKLVKLRNEGKLDNFRIWFIYPKLSWIIPSMRRHPTTKRLLVNYNMTPPEAYPPPCESLQLSGGILEVWAIYPWNPIDTLKRICAKEGITYKKDKIHYTIRKLIAEAEKVNAN